VDSVVKPDEIVGLSFLVLVAGFILGLVLIGAETVAAFVGLLLVAGFILGLVLIGAETVAAFVGLSVQYNYKSLHLA